MRTPRPLTTRADRPSDDPLQPVVGWISGPQDVVLHALVERHLLFLDHARYSLGHSPRSLAIYRHAFANFTRYLRAADSTAPLAQAITDVDAWIIWNRKEGRTPITLNTYWRSLRPFFTYLEVKEGLPSPFHGQHPPRFQKPAPKALREADLKRVLDAARNYPWPTTFLRERASVIVAVMLYAGLRRMEVLHLQFADLDLAGSVLQVQRGKGRYGGKSRTAYIPAELRVTLKRYLVERARSAITCPELIASTKNRGLSLEQLRRDMQKIRIASGVHVSPHRLRHSFVTQLLRRGTPLHVAQQLAGHADIQTTAGYLTVFSEELHHHASKLRFR